jgi:type IV secretion system protein VirD4
VLESTLNDPSTFMDWKGFLLGNQRTIESFLSTASTALLALGHPDLAELTARSTIDFKALRHRKTALYVMARQQDMQFYSFVLNLFYTDLIKSLLSELNDEHLPCYLMLDEFGHLTLPGFAVFATTARKYRVGFAILCQSLSQLESRYGIHEARTIREGLQTEIFLPGVGIETAKELEGRPGVTARR